MNYQVTKEYNKTSMYHRLTVKYDIVRLSDTIKTQRAATAKYW